MTTWELIKRLASSYAQQVIGANSPSASIYGPMDAKKSQKIYRHEQMRYWKYSKGLNND